MTHIDMYFKLQKSGSDAVTLSVVDLTLIICRNLMFFMNVW